MSEAGTIGERLRGARRYRGMSLQVLADRSGLSKGFLSMVENGKRSLERRSHISALADALEVSVAELTGQPYRPPPQPNGAGGHGTVPRVRIALLSSSLDEPADVRPRGLDLLLAETDQVEALCDASHYGDFGRLLPDLMPELHVMATIGDEREQAEALRALVRASHAAFYLLKDLGYLDLAQIAVQQARDAASRLDEPALVGLAAFVRSHALLPAGAYSAALSAADRAAERLQIASGDPAAVELYGMLHLSAALASVSLNRPAEADVHLAEAQATADRTGEGNVYGLHFGPTNVSVWRVALMVELGEIDKADEIARTVHPELIPSRGRQAAFYADWGRAIAQIPRRERDAVERLRQAERLAPEQIRNSPLVRETVSHLLTRSRAAAAGRDLQGLAYRFGVS
ncbi:helix-turn-helix domain-containing protein [Sphaerisporangium corydalis]|uniref:Helix-turn-helix domain-containing protein n=1 Tax=Sphaerisporangium corydalis TaxID=1441875 RepID=A0ABV9E8T2_9ACTN|nr:helix-turn-helix transcriptional regulator [Sphaerisporangium corydalis]